MSTLVQQPAPALEATAVLADGTMNEGFSLEDLRGRYVVLFFYPLDFTFVCPTEILAFDHAIEEYRARDCEVLGVSVDSPYTHLAWRETPVDDGGIGPIRFPLVSDLKKTIARKYGVLVDDSVALRATFLLDREGIVRHQVVNDLSLGRSVSDTLRTLDALRHTERSGKVCPANWEDGKEAMEPTTVGVAKYLQDFALDL